MFVVVRVLVGSWLLSVSFGVCLLFVSFVCVVASYSSLVDLDINIPDISLLE